MAKGTEVRSKTLDVEHSELTADSSNLEIGEHEFQTDARLDRIVLLKLDLLLMPVMSIIFIFLFLDRANIGNARVAGLQKDLQVTDMQYQLGT